MAVEERIEGERGCGYRNEGGVYIMGGTGGPGGSLKRFYTIHPPVPYQVKSHRSARIIDADSVFLRLPMDQWWVGSSARTEIKKAGDVWHYETFGMTAHARIHTGECEGATNPDEALNILIDKVTFDVRLQHYFASLANVDSIPNTAILYENLRMALRSAAQSPEVGYLLSAVACVWRLSYVIPPSRKAQFIQPLMRMLVLMGLPRDAMAMRMKFDNPDEEEVNV